MSWRSVTFTVGAVLLVSSPALRADLALSNGRLSVEFRQDNGAIDNVLYDGWDFYKAGMPVSDWGLQLGSETFSFVRNTTSGGAGQFVSVLASGESIVVTGTYTGAEADVDFTRESWLVPRLDVLRTRMTFVNCGSDLMMSVFDTFDPDQGVGPGRGPETQNDVFLLATQSGNAKVGLAAEPGGLSVVMGSLHPSVTVAAGDPFHISMGSLLNAFYASPYDGEGTLADGGLHVGLQAFLPSGGTLSFTYDQAYGPTPEDAKDAFVHANIPAPGAELLGLIGLAIIGSVTRRSKCNPTPRNVEG